MNRCATEKGSWRRNTALLCFKISETAAPVCADSPSSLYLRTQGKHQSTSSSALTYFLKEINYF